MPAIASLEDLKAAQKDLLDVKDLDDLKREFKKWRGRFDLVPSNGISVLAWPYPDMGTYKK